MTKISALLLLATLSPSLTFSQSEGSVPYLTDSSRSIQFGIESFFMRTFGDGTISYRQHFSPSTAVRLGIKFNGSRMMNEKTVSQYHGDTLMGRYYGYAIEDISVSFIILAQYQWYFPIEQDLYLFVGIGPEAGYEQREYYLDSRKSWTAGINGSIGAEWFASRRISLHAEYVNSALYRYYHAADWQSYSNNTRDYSENMTQSYELNRMNVLFGLSVHF